MVIVHLKDCSVSQAVTRAKQVVIPKKQCKIEKLFLQIASSN